MESVVEICKEVLRRLSKMDYERKGGSSKERLIFPNTFPFLKEGKTFTEEELLRCTRISEQELRFLFVEEFLKKPNNEYYYSVETPTEKKYRFGKTHDDIIIDPTGRSASIDVCIYERNTDNKYKRLFNIEFKNANASKKSISKDILKLMYEEENGAFVLLLKNTNIGTLINLGETRRGVIDKLVQSFNVHKLKEMHWNGGEDKYIELVILSLQLNNLKEKEPFIRYRKIFKKDLDSIKTDIEDWLKILD